TKSSSSCGCRLGIRLRLRFGALARCLGRFGRLGTVSEYLGDPDQGEFLPMAAPAPRILAAALLERDDLGAAALLDHLGSDRCAGDRRGAKRHGVAADDQHLTDADDLTGLARDLLDLEQVLGGNAVLLTAGLDDCEHLYLRVRTPVLGRPD